MRTLLLMGLLGSLSGKPIAGSCALLDLKRVTSLMITYCNHNTYQYIGSI